ncbi:hypothetical protein V6Z11_D02G027900 [Gossypium hirsutum]
MCSFGFKDLLNLCNYFITYFIRFSFANCLYVFTQHIIYVWQGEFHGVCFHYKVNADTTKVESTYPFIDRREILFLG